MRSTAPEIAVDFHGNLRSGFSAWLCGAAVRVGYAGHQQKECNRWLTTHRVPSGDRRTSRMDRNLELVRALGLPTAPLPSSGLALPAGGREAATRIVAGLKAGPGGFAVISPGASRLQAYKRPPADLLGAAARRIAERGVPVLTVWGPDEKPDALRAVEAAGDAARLAPDTDLPTLAALLERSRLFVGGDSGPLHMACAVGCPVVGVYGPTDPQVYAP